MGPRHKTVENSRTQSSVGIHGCSFNGATAQRPWRTRHDDGEFVGATERLQWGHGTKTVENCTLTANAPNATGQASMGPRHKDRGERCGLRWQVERRDVLQWGHGTKTVENDCNACSPASSASSFNGATARRPWRTPIESTVLQPRSSASMGPRHKDRGEPDSATWSRHDIGRASMGPRHKDRGERRVPAANHSRDG